jgi:rsbT co-antagonist protein RsbR
MATERGALDGLLATYEQEVYQDWISHLRAEGAFSGGRISEGELSGECARFLRLLREAAADGDVDAFGPAYAPVRDLLADLSRSRAVQGFSPRETATFVFSLKQPLFQALARHSEGQFDPFKASWDIGMLIDRLGLHTMEVFQSSREQLILRQQEEISELSTPVIKLWEGVLALPLIGTLDSQRTQVVMENLLESIVQQGAEIAIIDITGVPTVDTLTAQHLLKTVAAARLMGADCIISGIRPQIAQTMVHLGVELSVVSKASLADAFALALAKQGRTVAKLRAPAATGPAVA